MDWPARLATLRPDIEEAPHHGHLDRVGRNSFYSVFDASWRAPRSFAPAAYAVVHRKDSLAEKRERLRPDGGRSGGSDVKRLERPSSSARPFATLDGVGKVDAATAYRLDQLNPASWSACNAIRRFW